MIPRRDPETAPVLFGAQIRKRGRFDQYGTERARRDAYWRPVRTRNGLPVKHYTNWQTPRKSMTEAEAARALGVNVAPGFPLQASPGATLPKGSPPTMSIFKSSAAKATEQWRFMNENDPDLFGRDKANWRATKAAKARLAAKQDKAAKHGKSGKK